jgi:Domain of unknown function (DUF4189)
MMPMLKAILAALFLGALLSPSTSQAQVKLYYPCPNGPSVNEVEHHREPEYDNQGRIYGYAIFCVAADEAPQEQQPPERPTRSSRAIDAGFAIAWHKNASEVWTVWNTANQTEAEKLALQNCNSTMRGGCTLAVSGENSSGAIARSATGMLVVGRGQSPDDAKADAIKNCEKLHSRCQNFISAAALNREFADTGEKVNATVGTFTPAFNEYLLNTYTAAAFTSAPRQGPYKETLWISGGHSDLDTALRSALGACTKDTAKACEIATYSANGSIHVYKPKKGDLIIYSENNSLAIDETEYAQKLCKERKTKCTFMGSFEARKAGLVKQDFLKTKGKELR